mmetsp:Transcript_48309/g.105157  ORF Transcript_48309/g.105157 Transcript_48309/m.105157 type:complete len:225 (+) Transcript_48309:64-738(+)|eukprot:CAMPEP_0204392042 /NCGR_PEP_ID=MMETSP0469-20131031/61557_1 /ASSEMBLY_ACC=CAM_ASM_000384 /TAXON_ID=2969 /ORGANISM="Oxyrrhis marina" /LENGTH=224 /DNA_ID=CAMNT_0051386007 /DNA_START=64 /DNA_END=738 /DNA_ORIENTATION=-
MSLKDRPRRLGVAIDFELTRHPKPVFLDQDRNLSRAYRASRPDTVTAVLQQPVIDNRLDPKKWQGNGFQGHVQYVPYFGKNDIRPPHYHKDLQFPTFPKENSRALNSSQMPGDMVQRRQEPTDQEMAMHDDAMKLTRTVNSYSELHHHHSNPHQYFGVLDSLKKRDEQLAEITQRTKSVRAAGLAAINPAMGTSGSLPNLHGKTGKQMLNQWRSCSPWALHHDE